MEFGLVDGSVTYAMSELNQDQNLKLDWIDPNSCYQMKQDCH